MKETSAKEPGGSPQAPAPGWFLGGARAWREARGSFSRGAKLDVSGAQNNLIGAVFILGAWAAFGFGALDAVAAVSLNTAGLLAVAWGSRERSKGHALMSLGILRAISESRQRALLEPQADVADREALLGAARESREGSEPGSFEELASGIAEGRLSRRQIVAPLLWLGGMRFKGLGASVAKGEEGA
jgi:hypothetical protein